MIRTAVRARGPVAALVGILRKPLLISAGASSLAGASTTLIAARRLDLEDFAVFAGVALVFAISQGALRAIVHEPSLVLVRGHSGLTVSARQMTVPMAACAPPAAAIFVWAFGFPPLQALLLTGVLVVTWVSDWVRYRLILNDGRWYVAIGDLARLALTAALLTPLMPADPAAFALALGVLPGFLVLIGLKPFFAHRRGSRVLLGVQAAPQGLDFLVLQLSSNIPLLVAGSTTSAIGLFASVRLAQTLMGPLNFLFMAFNSNLMADGATDSTLHDDVVLIAQGRRLARALAAVAAVIVVVVVICLCLFGGSLIKVDPFTIGVGALLVGATYVGSGWSGLRVVVLRLIGQARTIVKVRVAVVSVVLLGYGIGWALGSAEAAIGVGLSVSAVAYPLLFGFVSRWVFASRERPAV